jgi:hypothetical protein
MFGAYLRVEDEVDDFFKILVLVLRTEEGTKEKEELNLLYLIVCPVLAILSKNFEERHLLAFIVTITVAQIT